MAPVECGMLTSSSYIVNWQLIHVSHVAEGREDHESSQDTGKRVSNWYN